MFVIQVGLFASNVSKIWCAAACPIISITCAFLKSWIERYLVAFSVNFSAKTWSMRRERGSLGRKLLVLRFRRNGAMGPGVVDDFTEQLLAKRCQRTFPQFPSGLALLHKAPFLRGDGARVHPVG